MQGELTITYLPDLADLHFRQPLGTTSAALPPFCNVKNWNKCLKSLKVTVIKQDFNG